MSGADGGERDKREALKNQKGVVGGQGRAVKGGTIST